MIVVIIVNIDHLPIESCWNVVDLQQRKILYPLKIRLSLNNTKKNHTHMVI